jgi:hypothetical protein
MPQSIETLKREAEAARNQLLGWGAGAEVIRQKHRMVKVDAWFVTMGFSVLVMFGSALVILATSDGDNLATGVVAGLLALFAVMLALVLFSTLKVAYQGIAVAREELARQYCSGLRNLYQVYCDHIAGSDAYVHDEFSFMEIRTHPNGHTMIEVRLDDHRQMLIPAPYDTFVVELPGMDDHLETDDLNVVADAVFTIASASRSFVTDAAEDEPSLEELRELVVEDTLKDIKEPSDEQRRLAAYLGEEHELPPRGRDAPDKLDEAKPLRPDDSDT